MRKEERRKGKKRKKGGVEQDKPEQVSANTHTAADAHYDPVEAQVRVKEDEERCGDTEQ